MGKSINRHLWWCTHVSPVAMLTGLTATSTLKNRALLVGIWNMFFVVSLIWGFGCSFYFLVLSVFPPDWSHLRSHTCASWPRPLGSLQERCALAPVLVSLSDVVVPVCLLFLCFRLPPLDTLVFPRHNMAPSFWPHPSASPPFPRLKPPTRQLKMIKIKKNWIFARYGDVDYSGRDYPRHWMCILQSCSARPSQDGTYFLKKKRDVAPFSFQLS